MYICSALNRSFKMSKNLDSPTKLTEFAPLSPEERNVGVGFLFSRFFKRAVPARDTHENANSGGPSRLPPNERKLATDDTWCSNDDEHSAGSRDSNILPFPMYADVCEGRSLPNVLKRISNLLAMNNSGLQAYKDTAFKQYWMPDSVSKECFDCCDRFTTFRRRHHCRVCGQIFCSRCCNEIITGKVVGCTGDLRVCTYCCKVVLSYLQSPDIAADLSADLRALQDDLQSKFGERNSSPVVHPTTVPQPSSVQSPEAPRERSTGLTRTLSRRKHSYQEDRFALGRNGNLASSTSFLTSEDLHVSAEERWKALQESSSLRALYEYMKMPDIGVPLQSHRYRLSNFPTSFIGTELVDWLLESNRAATKEQAVRLGQALLDAGYLECISHLDPVFRDAYVLYRLKNQPGKEASSSPSASAPEVLWKQPLDEPDMANTDSEAEIMTSVKEHDSVSIPSSGSTFYLDLDVQENRVLLRRPPKASEHQAPSSQASTSTIADKTVAPSSELNNTGISREFLKDTLLAEGSEVLRELVPSVGWHHVQNLRTDNGEKEAYTRLSEAFEQHERSLLQQMLSAEGLSQSWSETVLPLVHQVVDLVRPDVKNAGDFMDIRQYVQFKKVSGGERLESCVISGVVCTKNVAHRGMAVQLTDPRILLFGCSIIYERVEGRFLSLEPLMMQEQDYLKHAVARIVSLKPNLVLVERTVSRLAQDLLREHGITLVLNVKASVLERLARLTQADILTCVDAHLSKPMLGMCHNFFLRNFTLDDLSTKTLMFFEGCATHLGCTVTLRGGTTEELKRLKKVMRHLILVNYSWKLEKSFLMDEFAMPPSIPNDSFFADEESKEACDSSLEEGNRRSCDRRKLQCRTVSKDKVMEEKKSEAVVDQSDPLHQYLAGQMDSKEKVTQQLAVATLPFANRFRKALDGTVLSSSPYLQYSVPYLETEAGRQCALRRFFPEQVFWSPQLVANSTHYAETPALVKSEECRQPVDDDVFVVPCHPLMNAKLTKCVESWEVQSLLSNFRAVGGRLRHPEADTPPAVHAMQSTPVAADAAPPHWPQPPALDALNPMNHQRLKFLFCSFSPESNNAPAFCGNPWVVPIEFYGRNDIPLGQFLQHYCFSKSYTCPSPFCSTPIFRHIRRFVHDGCCVEITLKELERKIPVEGKSILMWSWCSICKVVSPVVPISVDTWTLSFAKYLELRFHGSMFTRRGKDQVCQHSLHHDHYQYFGFNDIVAFFKLSSVALWEISLPPHVLVGNRSGSASTHAQAAAIEEVKQLALKGHEVFSMVLDKLCQLATEESKAEEIQGLKQQLKREHASFKSKIEEIQLKLTSPTLESCWSEASQEPGEEGCPEDTSTPDSLQCELGRRLWDIEDCLVQLKRMIAEAVAQWSVRLTDLSKRKDEKSKKTVEAPKAASNTTEMTEEQESEKHNPSAKEHECSEDFPQFQHTSTDCAESAEADAVAPAATSLTANSEVTTPEPWSSSATHKKNSSSLDVPEEASAPEMEASRGHGRSFSEGASSSVEVGVVPPERRSVPQVPPAATVKQIFSQLLPSNLTATIVPNPLDSKEHHLLPPSLGPAIVVYEKEPSSIIAYTLCSVEYHKKLAEGRNPPVVPDGPPPSPIEMKRKSQQDASSSELMGSAESTRRTMLSFLRGGSSPNLQRHANCSPRPEFEGVQFTAGSVEQDENMLEGNSMDPRVRPNTKPGDTEASIDVHFSDAVMSFHCRVYLPEQFEALRSLVCPEGEESYARSLAHCVQWAARGGKSGSAFLKTKDDRFVLKEMKQQEVHFFMAIAFNYLGYIRRALEAGQPTLLGKIVGVYRVSYRPVAGGSGPTMKSTFLVMENLFYGHNITQRFDLKGSVRNRLVVPTLGKSGEIVLLDENLLKMTCDSPLYIHPHSKVVLTLAIEKDTQFLSSQSIVDYSLLVGWDEERRELVLGIVDYVSEYTYIRKLETMVKSSGLLGGQGKQPTIVSPEEYQSRFVAAMHRYFLPVPDRWTGLGSGVDC